jgi:hypothetical protein
MGNQASCAMEEALSQEETYENERPRGSHSRKRAGARSGSVTHLVSRSFADTRSLEEGALLAERIDPQIASRIRVMAAQLLADQNFHEEVRRDAWEKMTRQEHKEMLEETPKELREHICNEILMQPPV